MGSSSLICGCGSYAFHQVVANRLAKQGWYSVSDLNVLLSFRARELKGIWKRLDTRRFAHRNGALLIRMDKRTPMDVALGKYRAGQPIPLHPTVALSVVGAFCSLHPCGQEVMWDVPPAAASWNMGQAVHVCFSKTRRCVVGD